MVILEIGWENHSQRWCRKLHENKSDTGSETRLSGRMREQIRALTAVDETRKNKRKEEKENLASGALRHSEVEVERGTH